MKSRLFLVLIILSGTVPAFGCSCIGRESVSQAYASTALIFSGKVLADSVVKIESKEMPGAYYSQKHYRFSVTHTYKGRSMSTVAIETGMGGGDCGYRFELNKEYIVYASLKNDSLRIYSTTICTRTAEFSIHEDLSLLKLSQKKSTQQTPLYLQKEFGSNPGNLRMYYYLPDSLKQQKMVVVLHGCSQSARSCAEQTGWHDLAKADGFALLFPEQDLLNNVSNCFNWFNADDQDTASGEAASIRNMMWWMKQRYGIEQIYVTGLSAGAAMANILMVNFPELISKGALFAGGPYGAAKNVGEAPKAMAGNVNKTPAEWAALAHAARPGYTGKYPQAAIFQGEGDYTVNKQNATELMKQWTALHNTDTLAENELERPFVSQHPRIKEFAYADSTGQFPVLVFMISRLGHALPVDPNGKTVKGGKTGFFATDIDFHSTAWVAEWFGLM
ncbi:MAG: PHB depolymerase family esterase [Bacteroidetes bacterium]|nr:PHB depolymerase family esterase [Bacteroidota bacterium]